MAETIELALGAAAWGILSAISLVIGAVIGVWRNPKKEIRAVFMAYGSGALIEALSIELFAHIVHMANGGDSDHRRLGEGPGKSLVYVAMAMALLGGSCFAGLNKVLNDAGGFARHAASLKEQVGKRRLMFYNRLAAQLQLVPIFAGLQMEELRQLASKMKKDVFEEGETIFNHEDLHSPIFFLLSGSVRIDIFRVPELAPITRMPSKMSKPVVSKSDWHSEGTIVKIEEPVGKDVVLDMDHSYFIQPHQLFGELAFITGECLSANAVAVEVSKALKLLTHDFIDLVESNPKIKQFLVNSAAQSMVKDRQMNIPMEMLMKEMEVIVFSAEEQVYTHVDESTPIYYLILGHIRLTYETEGDAYPSTQDPGRTTNTRIIRPGKLFGTDNFARGHRPKVTAVAHDRALALCLHREAWNQCKPLSTTCNKLAWSQAPPPDTSTLLQKPRDMDKIIISSGQLFPSLERDVSGNSHSPSEKCSKRHASKDSQVSIRSLGSVESKNTAPTFGEDLRQSPEITDAEVFNEASEKNVASPTGKEPEGGHHHQNAHAAIMIWLGILIDAVPESVVLGILASTSSSGSLLTFVIGVFLSNLPEAMSSSGTMAACGVKRTRILCMWTSIVVLTGVGAALGAVIFPPGSEEEEGAQYAIAAIEGMCGGAMLTMIANTALPEAFEQGGNVVGLSTLLGFLSALFVSVSSS
mmetsp:Transcript_34990/g.54322  ORF Transcript_34990/g.54322 Transcript_34990/m.54322 type:complete len:696 (+) Transcript_34990:103-2190(+)